MAPMLLINFQHQLYEEGFDINDLGQRIFLAVLAISQYCGSSQTKTTNRCDYAFEFGKCASLIIQPLLEDLLEFSI